MSRALPIRNEAGEVVRWFGTNTDVTEQIEAENALRELHRPDGEVVRIKVDQIVFVMSATKTGASAHRQKFSF